MKKIYISGPVTGMPNENRHAFEAAAVRLNQLGFDPIIPHHHVSPWDTWEESMRSRIRVMMDADAVFTLDGCDRSNGARVEIDLAGNIGIPVFNTVGDMAAYFVRRVDA